MWAILSLSLIFHHRDIINPTYSIPCHAKQDLMMAISCSICKRTVQLRIDVTSSRCIVSYRAALPLYGLVSLTAQCLILNQALIIHLWLLLYPWLFWSLGDTTKWHRISVVVCNVLTFYSHQMSIVWTSTEGHLSSPQTRGCKSSTAH